MTDYNTKPTIENVLERIEALSTEMSSFHFKYSLVETIKFGFDHRKSLAHFVLQRIEAR